MALKAKNQLMSLIQDLKNKAIMEKNIVEIYQKKLQKIVIIITLKNKIIIIIIMIIILIQI